MKPARIEKICTVCEKTFSIPPCRDWREHECSSECKVAARVARSKALMESRSRACERCGGAFIVKKSQIDSGHGKFCSQSCAMKTFTETDAFKVAMAKSGETYKANLRAGKFVRAKGADHPQWTGGSEASKARSVRRLVSAIGRASRPGRFNGSIERLLFLLELDAESGVLRWKNGPARVNGMVAGSPCKTGYRSIRVDGTLIPEHRVIYAMHHGVWPKFHVDHINCNRADNRPCNLRDATVSENARNGRVHCDNISGIKGVTRHRKRYIAQIYVDGHQIRLGSFSTAEEAGMAYADAAQKYFGEFARAA